MAAGRGIQIVQVTDEHRFAFGVEELKAVLLSEDIKELPVVIVSVAGAYREGKSFLLNFFLRYLMSEKSARNDGSWLGKPGESLEGFSWRGGSTRETTGILIWSKPFISELPSGQKVAILLMDTQGTFDSSSTVNDCSTIFALSTLLSSVQIYNLSKNIQEDHLQHLQLFTEYGKMVKEQSDEKAFQTLLFLIRDWQYPWEHPFGSDGGNALLQKRLQMTGKMQSELQDVREHIRSCFEKVLCFLMPYPGDEIFDPNFKGNISKISERFRQYVPELVSLIFRPDKLQVKMVNGRAVKAKELFELFNSYKDIFRDGSLPPTPTIMKATSDAGLLSAMREGLKEYQDNMDRECGKATKRVPSVDLKVLHTRCKELALNNYKQKKKLGKKDDIRAKKNQLSEDIDQAMRQYAAENSEKLVAVKEAAKAAYDAIINGIKKDNPLCVHPKDLENIHHNASRAALAAFDNGHKRITYDKYQERDDYVKLLENKYLHLQTKNETSNGQLKDDLRNKYFQLMECTITADPPFSPAQFERQHESSVARILEMFRERRNIADSYPEDIYKNQLMQTINQRYNEIKETNRSANRKLINTAIQTYMTHMEAVWNPRKEHLHPEQLKDEHESAKRLALATLSPNNRPLDISDEDKNHLQSMFTTRYNEFKETNKRLNEQAIQSAYNLFTEKLSEKRSADWTWFFVVPAVISITKNITQQYFDEAKEEGITEFYRKRKTRGAQKTDNYYQELIKKIDSHNPFIAIGNAVVEVVEQVQEVVKERVLPILLGKRS